MIIIDPCERLKVILTQMLKSIVGSANPANKKEYERLMQVTIPDLEIRAYQLAERCKLLNNSDEIAYEVYEIKKFFEKAIYDLENRYIRYKELTESSKIIQRRSYME